jgi:hypothetical protein
MPGKFTLRYRAAICSLHLIARYSSLFSPFPLGIRAFGIAFHSRTPAAGGETSIIHERSIASFLNYLGQTNKDLG